MRGLKDKIVIVAGGASGIGAATARRLAEEGAIVMVGDLNERARASLPQRSRRLVDAPQLTAST
jgi:NAD(P)-dependent dehydrogenase (short-subunit alcohol dehydrogenase family)